MKSKSLLIAVAAFAVTTTGALAYNDSVLQNSGLSDEQIAALQEARDLRQSGDKEAARDLLAEAGIGEDELRSLHQAAHEARDERREAIHEAIENNDFDAFLVAITDSPLADIITTEDDFDTFKEAHELRQEGNKEEARELLSELGIERGEGYGHKHGKQHILSELSEEEREAFMVAKQANDKETMKAILEEAGVERSDFKRGHRHQ
tara:strand:- start:36 stop:656 length:621 start_codon:yes stop_codon:yes gene_type:complete